MKKLKTLAVEGKSQGVTVWSFDLPLGVIVEAMRIQTYDDQVGLDKNGAATQTGINRALLEGRLPNIARSYEKCLSDGRAIEHSAFVCVDIDKKIELVEVVKEVEIEWTTKAE